METCSIVHLDIHILHRYRNGGIQRWNNYEICLSLNATRNRVTSEENIKSDLTFDYVKHGRNSTFMVYRYE